MPLTFYEIRESHFIYVPTLYSTHYKDDMELARKSIIKHRELASSYYLEKAIINGSELAIELINKHPTNSICTIYLSEYLHKDVCDIVFNYTIDERRNDLSTRLTADHIGIYDNNHGMQICINANEPFNLVFRSCFISHVL